MPQDARIETSETPDTQPDPANRWWALVSPVALKEPAGFLTTPHDAGRVLSRPYDLGPIHIAPGERQLVDYVPLFAQGWKSAVSWPVLVSGDIQGSRQETDRAAAKTLHRLCCLLALAWSDRGKSVSHRSKKRICRPRFQIRFSCQTLTTITAMATRKLACGLRPIFLTG